MIKLSVFLIMMAVVFLLSSCKTESSDDVEVSSIYQSYLYLYNKTDNTTTACAQFRDGGALGNDVILNSPSSVSINGDVLVHQNIGYRLYYHYYKEYSGKINTGSYLFTDKYSKNYDNIADLNTLPEIGFQAGLDTISKAADFVFSWTGDPYSGGEEIELEMISVDTSLTFYASPAGASSITILKSDLNYYATGDINMILRRSRIDNLQAATAAGGQLEMEYSCNKSVYIKD